MRWGKKSRSELILLFLINLFFNRRMKLAVELRSLVRESVALLGVVIKHRVGNRGYQRIEKIRRQMTTFRTQSGMKSERMLEELAAHLSKVTVGERYEIAHSFTLMLELMNTSENAYRSFKLSQRSPVPMDKNKPVSITYVLTAHPTEARAPKNIGVFHNIQSFLISILENTAPGTKIILTEQNRNDLKHLLEIAWQTPIVRQRSPKVADEAEYIYSQVFRENVLFSLLDANHGQVPFYLGSWVGGDKDGHPGVDEKTMIQSLTVSRGHIVGVLNSLLKDVRVTVDSIGNIQLGRQISNLQSRLRTCRVLKTGDLKKVQASHALFLKLQKEYQTQFNCVHPQLRRMEQIYGLFPGLVIPLELRESSDVLMSKPEKGVRLAIDRMLSKVGTLCQSGDPCFYIRGFIIAMTQSAAHIKMAASKQEQVFGAAKLPIIPLFEEAASLARGDVIMGEVLSDSELKSTIKKHWRSTVEMMVGYSDSSKEGGVLPSRLAISLALPKLEKVCLRAGVTPVFFHGSGGSVDRGGGNIEDQMIWWPRSAVARYKVTIQGEMVERSLATAAIARGQLEKIAQSSSVVLSRRFHAQNNAVLDSFSQKITEAYRKKVTAPDFLRVVSAATPYSYINYLKIGSRPAKRHQQLTVKSLRAIPWILCWTQTRLLFPTWWGVGSAWHTASARDKAKLKTAFKKDAVFTSYVKALDFTLAKVELEVFKIYLKQSYLPTSLVKNFSDEVDREYRSACQFVNAMTGSKKRLAHKEWLKESIDLRAPMIHPLNVLQIIAQKNKEIALLRLTVTGISAGMMATG
jgi:phosphoenolpyruvate carboxylase